MSISENPVRRRLLTLAGQGHERGGRLGEALPQSHAGTGHCRKASRKGVSQQILTDLIHRLIRESVWLFNWLSNRRTCWLTFAALRM
jgi:hypothetical protein